VAAAFPRGVHRRLGGQGPVFLHLYSPVATIFQAVAGHILAKRASISSHESGAQRREHSGGKRDASTESLEASWAHREERGN
jgi:hypothetical protein